MQFDTRREELANSLTHGLGLSLSLAGALALLLTASQTADMARLGGCCVYAAMLVAVYAASTLSHLVYEPRLRRLFRILDQAFIYLLIVGTYTPLALVYLHGGWLWVLFIAMWVIALIGFVSKTLWRHHIEAVSLSTYALLGWMPILATISAWQLLPGPMLLLILGGGLCYTVGLLFLYWGNRVPFFHAVWHLLVMAGSACHYAAIFRYVALPSD